MAQSSTVQKLKQTETEIAVLQVQYTHINEKVDGIKTDLKDLRDHMDAHLTSINQAIENSKNHFEESMTTLKAENTSQHSALEKKVNALEKWRWMLMGAGILAGALGWPVLEKLLGM